MAVVQRPCVNNRETLSGAHGGGNVADEVLGLGLQCGLFVRSRGRWFRSWRSAPRPAPRMSASRRPCPMRRPPVPFRRRRGDGWSGQPGASGHPLMQPDAILAAVADFKNCIERMWPDAARRGISRASFDTSRAGLEPDVKIMDFVDAQPEFTKAFWDYVDLLVTDERIASGREMLTQHAAAFEAVERAYGVDRHIIAAIWGIETKYGAVAGERPVIRSAATLACVGRRQAYFKDEFLAALEILHRGDIRPEQLKGSWAGAFGLDPVHADRVQALCGRFRRRRAARRGRLGARRDRLDGESSEEGRMGHRARPGATRSWCRRASTSCSPIRRAS